MRYEIKPTESGWRIWDKQYKQWESGPVSKYDALTPRLLRLNEPYTRPLIYLN